MFVLTFFLFNVLFVLVSGMQQFCQESTDCSMRVGASCQNSECICYQSPDSPHPRPCPPGKFGKQCSSDADCGTDLFCDSRTCVCRRGLMWDPAYSICVNDEHYSSNKRYDLTRDVIIPSVILVTLAVTASLCYKIFCNRKSWRRRRRGADVARALEEAQLPYHVNTPQPTTWIASYRVFGTVERGPPPCLLLPVGPPPYEDALKHKVILSSYQPPTTDLVETTPL